MQDFAFSCVISGSSTDELPVASAVPCTSAAVGAFGGRPNHARMHSILAASSTPFNVIFDRLIATL